MWSGVRWSEQAMQGGWGRKSSWGLKLWWGVVLEKVWVGEVLWESIWNRAPNITKFSVSGMVALVSLPWNWRRNPNRCSFCLPLPRIQLWDFPPFMYITTAYFSCPRTTTTLSTFCHLLSALVSASAACFFWVTVLALAFIFVMGRGRMKGDLASLSCWCVGMA